MRVMYNQVSWIDAPPPSLQEVQTNPLVSLAALGRKMSIENLGGKRLSISESSQSSKLPTARRSDSEAVTPRVVGDAFLVHRHPAAMRTRLHLRHRTSCCSSTGIPLVGIPMMVRRAHYLHKRFATHGTP
eukprot:7379608-Prymnesium_polylepis.1